MTPCFDRRAVMDDPLRAKWSTSTQLTMHTYLTSSMLVIRNHHLTDHLHHGVCLIGLIITAVSSVLRIIGCLHGEDQELLG